MMFISTFLLKENVDCLASILKVCHFSIKQLLNYECEFKGQEYFSSE